WALACAGMSSSAYAQAADPSAGEPAAPTATAAPTAPTPAPTPVAEPAPATPPAAPTAPTDGTIAPPPDPGPLTPPPPAVSAPAVSGLGHIQIHGLVSEGAFVSTSNDYIGHSSRGSVELFHSALNVSSEITDQLRVGMQLFTHDEGSLGNYTPKVDWAL